MSNHHHVLVDGFDPAFRIPARLRQALLIGVGVLVLTVAAQTKIPVMGSPVAINLGTLAVLGLGAVYGPRLGLMTLAAYLAIGALGFDIFQSSDSDLRGLAYIAGPTGGYLLGFVLAMLALGKAARAGWDRSPIKLALAMLLGNVLIYVPGLLWLGFLFGWDKPILAWGLTPFLFGDALKLALASTLLPASWKLFGNRKNNP